MGKHMKIISLKAKQIAIIMSYEDQLSKTLSDMYKRDVRINFSTYKVGPDIPKGSILKELQK